MATLAREIFLSGLGRGTPFLTYFPAIMLSSILADSAAGAIATLASVAVTFFWFEAGAPSGPEAVALLVFLISSAFILVISSGWQLAIRQSLESRSHELEQMAELRTLLDTIPDVIWLKDPTGTYVACNARFEALYGAPEDAIVGKRDSDFVGPEVARLFYEADLAVIEANHPIRSEREETFLSDGHREYIETVKAPVRGRDGKLLGVLGIGRDMTEKRQTLRDLEINEERLRLATESIHDSIWDWDLTTGFVYRSSSWWTMLGYSQPQGCETLEDARSSIHPDDLARVTRASQEAIEKCGSYRVETRMKCADGSWLWVESRGKVSACVDGKALRVSGLNTNIQARKEAEEEKERLQLKLQSAQKMESLGHLAAGIAHDMNNVLGAILSLASTYMVSHQDGTPTTLAFEKISRAARRGGEMVKGLLSFSRQTTMNQEVIDVNQLIDEEVSFLKQTILARAQFELDLAEDLKPVRGDPNAIKNLLMNLCVNSVDAMLEPGKITIRTRNKGDLFIEIREIDNGVGMPPEVLTRALDPFFTTKPVGKGTGLGLTTALSTVRNHGGELEIQSLPGEGTSVIITLPVSVLPETKEGAVRSESEAKFRPLTILLVEDDSMVQEATRELLEVSGHSVLSVTSGEGALQALKEGAFVELVIMDMTMPGLGGRATLPLLRERYPELPVVLVTGLADEGAQLLASQFNRVGLLAKPFDYSLMQRMIDTMLG